MLSLMQRLDAGDRALFLRVAAAPARRSSLAAWHGTTHLGGASVTILVTLATIGLGYAAPWQSLRVAGMDAAAALLITHLVAQAVKRTAKRARPSGMAFEALIAAPDKFSFPSGHSIAAMSLALTYGWHFPAIAPVLTVVALLVGCSRVRLGVHDPGDVAAGFAIAAIGAAVVLQVAR